jgi:hypothetical protein
MTPVLNPNDPNVVMLELVARHLGHDLCGQLHLWAVRWRAC